jgi:hypothetical protein
MKNCIKEDLPFEYIKPAPLNQRVILLERDGTVDVGAWKGPVIGSNARYIAWHPLPARNLALERTVL